MKIVILGDTHLGARGNSQIFHEHFREFYSDFFFPYLKEHKIDKVIQLGDLMDERPHVNYQTLKSSKEYFFEPIKNNKIHMDVLVGNHDSHFKNTISINAPRLLLDDYKDFIQVIDKPQTLEYDKVKIALIPWICKSNQEECLAEIDTTKANICMGHFDIQGFEMFKNSITSTKGLPQKLFERFFLTLSGHFHTRSKIGNILYTGTPYEMCWSDYNDPKGFHVLDTDTLELEFIENPYKIHEKHVYTADGEWPLNLTGKYVKLFIEGSYDPLNLDMWISKIEEQGPADFKKIETNLAINDVMQEAGQIQNIENYSIMDIAKENIKDETAMRIFHELYTEALALNDQF